MTKRNHNFERNNNKKPKLDDDIDALWGEDLDESTLDDCIKLATQVFDENKISTQLSTSLPSYSVFKEPGRIICSTQLDSNVRPSTSVTCDIKKQLEILQQKYQEKEGEVIILRSQLKESKTHHSVLQEKCQDEWKKKLSVTEKQVHSVISELQFKNLEIANLKQKLSDVIKHNTTIPSSEIKTVKTKNQNESIINILSEQKSSGCKLYGCTIDYPLRDILFKISLNSALVEKHVLHNKLINSCRNAIPYLQNQTIPTRTIVDRSNIDISDILPSIYKLISFSKEEINFEQYISEINRIICLAFNLVLNLHNILGTIQENLGTEDILEGDSSYLRNPENYFTIRNDQELGVRLAEVLDFISKLLLHCDYLRDYLCKNKRIVHEEDIFLKKYYIKVKDYSGHDFLKKIIDIIKLCGQIRKSHLISKFLTSTIRLFVNICLSRSYDNVCNILCEFVKELIFLRPSFEVIFQITFLLKEASMYPSFLEFLFNKSKSCSTNKKDVIYFNNDACRFYIFVLLFDNCLYKIKEIPFDVVLNLLSFINNTYKSSYWIHHQNIQECECLPQLYKLEMEILFISLKKYMEHVRINKLSSEWRYFFKNKLISKIFSLMTFHSDELIGKYITAFSQFKVIEKKIESNYLCELESLDISEGTPEVSHERFSSINF